MPKIALTDISIKRLPLPEKGQTIYFDNNLSNFGIRVSQGGAKTFLAILGKQRRKKTIGKYPAISLKMARREAQRLLLSHSSNPLERPPMRHSEAVESFLTDCSARIRERTVNDYRRILNRHFDFGTKTLAAITKTDIVDRLDKLRNVPSERHHAFVAARVYFNWCVKQGFVDQSPIERIAPTTATPSRERILDDAELATIYKAAQPFTKPFGTIVQLLILTGLRRSEATKLHRSWITGDVLTIPGTATKNGYPHTLPLTKTVLELLKPLPNQLFISPRGLIFSNWGNSKKKFDTGLEIEPYRIHDIRRTFSSTHARLGTPIHVTEKLLNHVTGSLGGVAGVYNRYDYIPEMRVAMDSYDNHIQSITA